MKRIAQKRAGVRLFGFPASSICLAVFWSVLRGKLAGELRQPGCNWHQDALGERHRHLDCLEIGGSFLQPPELGQSLGQRVHILASPPADDDEAERNQDNQ